MEFKFPKGAKLVRRDAPEESIAGEPFELRETSIQDEIEAGRNAESRKTNEGLELVRLAFVSFRGKAVKQPFAEIMQFNAKAQKRVNAAFREVSGIGDEDDDAPLVDGAAR